MKLGQKLQFGRKLQFEDVNTPNTRSSRFQMHWDFLQFSVSTLSQLPAIHPAKATETGQEGLVI